MRNVLAILYGFLLLPLAFCSALAAGQLHDVAEGGADEPPRAPHAVEVDLSGIDLDASLATGEPVPVRLPAGSVSVGWRGELRLRVLHAIPPTTFSVATHWSSFEGVPDSGSVVMRAAELRLYRVQLFVADAAVSAPDVPADEAVPAEAEEEGLVLAVDDAGHALLIAGLDPSDLAAVPPAAAANRSGPRAHARTASAAVSLLAERVALGIGLALVLILVLAVGVALPLFSRFTRDDVVANDRRARLFETILAEPGVSFGRLRDRLQMASGTAQHHLRLLEQHDLIVRVRDGRTTRYFPRGPRIVLPPPRQGAPARIMELLAREPGLTAREIAGRLGQRVQSTWEHLHRLRRRGLVSGERSGRAYAWSVPLASVAASPDSAMPAPTWL